MYQCDCDDCKSSPTVLNLGISEQFKKLLNAGEKAFKQLHKNKGYKPADLKNIAAYQDLINETYGIFNKAVTDNVVSKVLKSALQSDAFLVAGLKTHAQLFEASTYLINKDGSLKSYAALENDLNKLNVKYNATYLESEYQFATGSATMADKWNSFDDTGRYYLQYRTANDNRVRDEHEALNGITLPKEDPFWNSYYAPNGWRCRCNVVEVLKDKYPLSGSADAIAKGEKATTQIGKDGKNRLEIFRFNPGKDKVLFPPKMPYNKVAGANAVKKDLELRTKIKEQRVEIKQWAKENIVGKTVTHPKIKKPILFTSTGVKEALNQPHKFIVKKNEAVRDIKKLIKDAEFVKTDQDSKGREIEYHYLKVKINHEDSFIVIKSQSGNTAFHSIVEKIKEQ